MNIKAASQNYTDGHCLLVNANTCRARGHLQCFPEVRRSNKLLQVWWDGAACCYWSRQLSSSFLSSPLLHLILPALPSHSRPSTDPDAAQEARQKWFMCVNLWGSWLNFCHCRELHQHGNNQRRTRFNSSISNPAAPPAILGCWHITFNACSPANMIFCCQ